jgi:hypothetical protein
VQPLNPDLVELPTLDIRPPLSSASSSLTSVASSSVSCSSFSTVSALSDASLSSASTLASISVSTITSLSALEDDHVTTHGSPPRCPDKLAAPIVGLGSSPLSNPPVSAEQVAKSRLDRTRVSSDAVSLASSSTAVDQYVGSPAHLAVNSEVKALELITGATSHARSANTPLAAQTNAFDQPKKRGRSSNVAKAAMQRVHESQHHETLHSWETLAPSFGTAVGTPPVDIVVQRTQVLELSAHVATEEPTIKREEIDLSIESSDDERESTPDSRSLRPRRALPARFYDLTRRRAPRKLQSVSALSDRAASTSSTTLSNESASAPVPRGHLPGPSRLRPMVVDSLLMVNAAAGAEPGSSDEENDEENEEEEELELPKCRVCKAIIPVICVDSVIVWGPNDEEDDGNQECPRSVTFHVLTSLADISAGSGVCVTGLSTVLAGLIV